MDGTTERQERESAFYSCSLLSISMMMAFGAMKAITEGTRRRPAARPKPIVPAMSLKKVWKMSLVVPARGRRPRSVDRPPSSTAGPMSRRACDILLQKEAQASLRSRRIQDLHRSQCQPAAIETIQTVTTTGGPSRRSLCLQLGSQWRVSLGSQWRVSPAGSGRNRGTKEGTHAVKRREEAWRR